MWQKKHIEELIDDLTSEFLYSYVDGDPRNRVAEYGAYLRVLLFLLEEKMLSLMVSNVFHR
ncbi:MAG: hypothetical protein SOZ42_00485 [Candidatus Enterosoma sp.]|nr:hypothetical protein [Candidatus Enterosoma sp.]